MRSNWQSPIADYKYQCGSGGIRAIEHLRHARQQQPAEIDPDANALVQRLQETSQAGVADQIKALVPAFHTSQTNLTNALANLQSRSTTEQATAKLETAQQGAQRFST